MMKARITLVAAMLLIAVAASPLMAAQDEAKKQDGKVPQAKTPSSKFIRNFTNRGVTLTDDQKEKIEKIAAGHKGSLDGAKVGFTDEQRKARAEVYKKAKADGKKGKDLQAATDAVAKLTDDQKAAVKKARLAEEKHRAAALAVLTDEQRATLKGKKKPKNNDKKIEKENEAKKPA
jgi:Spy/CpxP family protein refolding chaperone